MGLAIAEPGGVRDSIGYAYDATTHQLSSLYDLRGGTTQFGYNRDGLPASTTLPNAARITQAYTTTHALNQIAYSATTVDNVAGFTYEYDALDRIRARIANSYVTKRTFVYDPNRNFLAGYGDYQETGSTHPTCSWDVDNGYVCTDPISGWLNTGGDSFAYDLSGNPTDHGAVMGSGNRLSQFNGYTLGYDPNGNLTSKTKSGFTQTFGWNSLGQLTSVTTNGVTVSYFYDGMGRRVRRRVNGIDTGYLYNGDDLLLEYDANGVQAKYTYYPDGNPHRVARGTSTYYYATDPQGSVLAVFDGSNQVLNQYSYLPFGEPQTATEQVPNRLRYTGREYEAESGLYYNNARWYDPQLHRFLSEDPIGIDGGTDQYAYTENDPENYVDPSGLNTAVVLINGQPKGCVEDLISDGWPKSEAVAACAAGGPVPLPGRGGSKHGSSSAGWWSSCPEVPPFPKGQSVDANVNTAKSVSDYTWGNGILGYPALPARMLWFASQVRKGGAWDYQSNYRQFGTLYEHAGNFNYGAAGATLGIPRQILVRAAGLQQSIHPGSRQQDNSPLGSSPYGDEPWDTWWIDAGIAYARNACNNP